MKYCTSCGAKIEDSSRFCTVCGAPVGDAAENAAQNSEAPKKAKKKFPLWIVIVLAAAILLGGAGYAAASKGVFTPAPVKFVDLADEAVAPVVETTAKIITGDETLFKSKQDGLNTDIIVFGDFPSTGEPTLDSIIKGASVTFQVNTGKDKDSLLGLKLNLDGSDVLTGFFKGTTDSLSLYLPELDDQYYTIEYAELVKIMEKYGLDAEQLELAAGAAGSLNGSIVDMETEEVEAILQKYVDIIYSAVNRDNTKKESGTCEYAVLDGSVKCTIVTFKPSEEDIDKVVNEFIDTLMDDDDLRGIIKAFCTKYAPDDAGSVMDGYENELKKLDSGREELVKEIAEAEPEFKISFDGKRIYSFTVLDKNGEGAGYESSGATIKERSDALVVFEADKAEALALNSYRLDGTKIIGKLDVNSEYAGAEVSADYEINLKYKSVLGIPYGEYDVTVDGEEYSLSVGAQDEGSVHEVRFKINGEDVDLDILTTDTESTVKEPSEKPEKITADNIEGIIGGMAMEALQILSEIYGG